MSPVWAMLLRWTAWRAIRRRSIYQRRDHGCLCRACRLAPANTPPSVDNALVVENANSDRLFGTVALHNANWKSDGLANHVSIAQAVLHLSGDATVWDPIEFTDGPVKGTAAFQPAPQACAAGEECLPQLDLRFGELKAADLQAALLGAKQQSTVFSELIARFSTSSASAGPRRGLASTER